jgi:endonuclease/exonuclease/phosphatase family metal-dependent hydrolase
MSDDASLGEQILRELPRLSPERRAEILELPATRASHARVLNEMPFLDVVEVDPGEPSLPAHIPSLRVVTWNAERCKALSPSARLLAATRADVFLLSEMDLGMARSAQLHTTRELARSLGCGYVFAVEFLELDLGGQDERDRHAGQENRIGYHGGAILSRGALRRPAVVRLETDGDWFDGERGERRVGGRIAVLASLCVAGTDVTLASVHLESHSGPKQRAEQLARLLTVLDDYAPGAPALIGGDLNTHTLSLEHEDREQLRQALLEDPERFRRPVPHEPLFEVAERAGFDWRQCNRLDDSTQRRREPSARGIFKLDWYLTRGLSAREPEVIAALDPDSGAALSDHEAIALRIEPDTTR